MQESRFSGDVEARWRAKSNQIEALKKCMMATTCMAERRNYEGLLAVSCAQLASLTMQLSHESLYQQQHPQSNYENMDCFHTGLDDAPGKRLRISFEEKGN